MPIKYVYIIKQKKDNPEDKKIIRCCGPIHPYVCSPELALRTCESLNHMLGDRVYYYFSEVNSVQGIPFE